MSDAGEKKIPEGIRNELEHSEVPLAVYRFVDGHIQTILVSDGLIRWQAPGCTREDLLKFLDTDMYKDVHREDIVFVATKAKEFAKSKDGRYEVVYRQKLYGKDEYRTLHAQGYHRVLDDGSECAIVIYDDVTSACETCRDFRNEFDNGLMEFLNNDSVEPFVIVDAKTHEIYMLSASVDKVWTPVKAFDSGITFEEYFFDPNEVQLITLDEVLSERTDRYFDTLTGLPNMEYCRMRGESYVTDIRIAGGTPSVVFFDIVGMKLYNNANGYGKGDEFLLNFAATLKKVFPNNLHREKTL